MKWIKTPISSDDVRRHSQNFGISLLEAALLLRRGVEDPEDVRFFLESDLGFSSNPFLFDQMEDAVERVLQACEEGERILVVGDRDVDGITSTALMVETLRDLGSQALWKVPMGDEPYGLTMETVDWALTQDVSLLITVDCGISNVQEISYATKRQLDVLVIDHHEPQEELPPALAIINPKNREEHYPFLNLAACGVVSKVAWALQFAKSELFGQSFCLLHAVNLEGGILRVEAVKIRNFLVSESFQHDFSQDTSQQVLYQLVDFLNSQEILVYGVEEQKNLLQRLFGTGAEINLTDFSQKLGDFFPGLRGLSWNEVKAKSRMTKYRPGETTDMEVMVNLLVVFLRRFYPNLDRYLLSKLDLVAVGTLADLMPLKGENRILVAQGLKVLSSTTRPGLRALLGELELLGRDITTQNVSWLLAPTINATGRMGVPDKAVELLLTSDNQRMNDLSAQLVSINKERRNLSTSGWERLLPKMRDFYDDFGKAVIVCDDQLSRGVTGIVASRAVNTFGVTSIVVCENEDRMVASLRTVKGFPTMEFLESLGDLFDDFGGHPMAAGFSMAVSHWDRFLMRAKEKIATYQIIPPEEGLHIDAELPPAHMHPNLWESVEKFSPYGEGHRPFVFAVRGALVKDFEFLGAGSKHLKILMEFGEYKWPAFAWNRTDWYDEGIVKRDTKVDVAFHLEKNVYQGKETLRWNLLDVIKSS